MRKLQSKFLLSCYALSVMVSILAFASTAAAQTGPSHPSDMSMEADATDNNFELRVTWKDFLDEDAYQLISTTAFSPGPMLTPNGTLGNGWEFITDLPANTTEFTHGTFFARRYAICGLKGLLIACFGPSNFAIPKFPPEPASVDSLQVSLRATDRLRVQWTQSANTRYSRAEVRLGGNILSSVENAPDQTVTFTGLQANTSHTLRVCVRNEEQTAADETCRSTEAATLLLAPLAPASVSVDQSDPSPRQRTISFSHDNRQSNAAAGISVRLIKDDEVLDSHNFSPNGFRLQNYEHTFTNLEPFTDYEVSVIPYNQTGVGPSAGIGFTTPIELSLTVLPLSGDSVMLHWVAPVIGEYIIEQTSGTVTADSIWQEIYTVRLPSPATTRVILEGLTDPRNVRLKWKFAYLRGLSPRRVATPLAVGAPELVSVAGRDVFFFDPVTRRLIPGTRYTVTFRTTSAGAAEYLLQRRTADSWATVAQIGSQFPSSTTFAANTLYTIQHESTRSRSPWERYRVCRRQPLALQNPVACGESDALQTVGSIRIRLGN